MNLLPRNATDDELLAYIDGWASLLEAERYHEAFEYTEHVPQMRWSPSLIRHAIKSYGDAEASQVVTLAGKPTDISQQKEIMRFKENTRNPVALILYDLNINGFVSDLTATFYIEATPQGLIVQLNDIHVM